MKGLWFITFLLALVESSNVTCDNGLCSNNTCEWGFYNTTDSVIGLELCSPCNYLREQYQNERCCYLTKISTPETSMTIINSTFENDTDTYKIEYTPPREICQHLWVEWGKCPPICDSIPSGEHCSMNIDCKNTNQCLDNVCCVLKYENCLSCAPNTGFCSLCIEGMAFNASGDLKCGYCPSWTYTTNNLCHLFTNCTAGKYVVSNGTLITDRMCGDVPDGFFSNMVNTLTPIQWKNCSDFPNTFISFAGTSTQDMECTPHRTCPDNQIISYYGNLTHDTGCSEKKTCPPGTYISDNGDSTTDRTCSPCGTDTFSDTNNQMSCSPHTVCPEGESYIFYGGSTHDSQCVPDSVCQYVTCLDEP